MCNSNDILNLLLNAGADVNISDTYGATPLMYAIAEKFDFEIIQELIKRVININHSDADGLTALMAACIFSDNSDIVLYLLKCGADPKIKDAENKTAVDYIKQNPALRGSEAYSKLVFNLG